MKPTDIPNDHKTLNDRKIASTDLLFIYRFYVSLTLSCGKKSNRRHPIPLSTLMRPRPFSPFRAERFNNRGLYLTTFQLSDTFFTRAPTRARHVNEPRRFFLAHTNLTHIHEPPNDTRIIFRNEFSFSRRASSPAPLFIKHRLF